MPVKVRVDRETLDLDLAAIAAAITPRTRIVIVNTPNNPTGRVYPPETLTRLADRAGGGLGAQRAAHLSSSRTSPTTASSSTAPASAAPAEFYPHTLIAYSYGKTLLAPGQRVGYLALPPALPDRGSAAQAGLQSPDSPAATPSPTPSCSMPCRSWTSSRSTWRGCSGKRDRLVAALPEHRATTVHLAGGHLLPLPALTHPG